MSIQLISVSYKHAPLAVRERFSFAKEARDKMMEELVLTKEIEECVLIATCNRTELYAYGNDEIGSSEVFAVMQKYLLLQAGLGEEASSYLRFFQNQKAVQHLFRVAAGLDSMVIGEDQILGQVKDAMEGAMEIGTTGVYLNTLFRYALTGAKKVKTETTLSKTSVSTASLAIKKAAQELDGLEGKRVLIIGASGKIGSIVLKNLQSISGVEIYATMRQTKMNHHGICFKEIPYEERYEALDAMDVVISATASPHYTITEQGYKRAVKTKKKRVLIDLAVPMDIEKSIKEEQSISYYNMDDFLRISKENNERKKKAAKEAGFILEDYEAKFERWRIFKENDSVMHTISRFMEAEGNRKNIEYAVWKLFYQVRDSVEPKELENFFASLRERNEQWED